MQIFDCASSLTCSFADISGVPGTGKTATVMRITRELQEQAKFRLIELNGMQMRTPEQAYVLLWKRISDEKGS